MFRGDCPTGSARRLGVGRPDPPAFNAFPAYPLLSISSTLPFFPKKFSVASLGQGLFWLLGATRVRVDGDPCSARGAAWRTMELLRALASVPRSRSTPLARSKLTLTLQGWFQDEVWEGTLPIWRALDTVCRFCARRQPRRWSAKKSQQRPSFSRASRRSTAPGRSGATRRSRPICGRLVAQSCKQSFACLQMNL